MARVAIATAVGGLVLFVWGFVFWAVLPYPRQVIHTPTAAPEFVELLRQHVREDGAYSIPGMPPEGDRPPDELEDWTARRRKGPIGFFFYSARGAANDTPQLMILGLTLNLLTAFFSAWLLFAAGLRSYYARVAFVLGLGVITALSTHLKQANWFYFPGDYTQLMCADVLLGSFLLGLVLAAIVKPAEVA